MKLSNALRAVPMALLLATTCILGTPALASTTTDFSDLWWIPSESGWGIQLIQEELTIFATMFVYGGDSQPTWYTATLAYGGSNIWAGPLYATTGPWFGAKTFDPSKVTRTVVGTMQLSTPNIEPAALTYTVNGVPQVKVIQRQTLAIIDFGGTYVGTLIQQGSGLPPCNPTRDTPATPATFQISQQGQAMTIVAKTNADTCTLSGAYTQGGHFGSNVGGYSCTSGDSGTFAIFEMARSWYDFRARTIFNSQTGCTLKGYISGLTQPPLPQ